CSLPDTLNSWFLVAQLHVWMCLVRMRQEGREGKFMCRYIVHSMWEDVEQRSKIMGREFSSSVLVGAYIPPQGSTSDAEKQLAELITDVEEKI
ncbi:hypothetical protein ATANTOWER_029441, partial [Ataeniobius toweri]|nr:hypothetical protein [Ataeniobius toweri]